MSSPIEDITVVCPTCGKAFETWYRASLNLQIDDFSEEYVRSVSVKTCPHCNAEVTLSMLIVREDGVWQVTDETAGRPAPDSRFRRYDGNRDELDFDFTYNRAETASLHEVVNGNDRVDIELLRRIALWKLDRILEVPETLLAQLRELAKDAQLHLDAPNVRPLIAALIECPGIGLPMASAILKFLRPDIFPIIDVRAYRALYGKRLYWRQDSADRNIALYLAYASAVPKLSAKTRRPLREIDEQLYCFDVKHNGKI